MPFVFQSGMRASLVATIIVMGGLGVLFSIMTASYFQEITLENRREQLVNLAELEVHYLRDKAISETVDLGMSVQSSIDLRSAIKNGNEAKVITLLDQHFYRAFVTLGILDLEKLLVFDKHLKLLHVSSEGSEYVDINRLCPNIIQQLRGRKSSEAIKPFNRMCTYDDKLQLISVVPIGGLRITGYLAVVVNPINNLIQSEEGIGIPLKVESVNHKVLYNSKGWPDKDSMHNILVARYGFKGGNPSPIGHFLFAFDITDLRKRLNKTRTLIIIIVSILTLLVVVIALALLQRSILSPLNKLISHLRLVKENKDYLSEYLHIEGSRDIVELSDDFNAMSKELKQLYSSLEDMAFTDSLTGIANRALLMDRLNQIVLLSKRSETMNHFIFMLMDLNRFKQINDTYGHNVGDRLLQLVADRLKSTIRESDTVARLGGDEFAILLNDVSEDKVAEELAQKITSVMSEPILVEGNTMDVGISIGISRHPENGTSAEQIIHCADVAMYHAKKSGIPYYFYKGEV